MAKPEQDNDKPPILVVDDNKEMLLVVGRVVEYFGYTCEGFSTGEDLVDYMDDNAGTFLCIVDVTLPGMSGYELVDYIDASNNPSRIILMSGEGPDGEFDSPSLIGYLLKPFGFAELQHLLDIWQAS